MLLLDRIRAAVRAMLGEAPQPAPRDVARTAVFIGIDVCADGMLEVTLWRGRQRNAIYARNTAGQALARALPQAIEEAVEMAQSLGESGVS